MRPAPLDIDALCAAEDDGDWPSLRQHNAFGFAAPGRLTSGLLADCGLRLLDEVGPDEAALLLRVERSA